MYNVHMSQFQHNLYKKMLHMLKRKYANVQVVLRIREYNVLDKAEDIQRSKVSVHHSDGWREGAISEFLCGT